MKKLKQKKAFTLIEVIISIAIFAAIALPLYSLFVQAFKTDKKANDVLNANYISQDYIEKLDAVTYSQALANLPTYVSVGDYYLTAKIIPYGTLNSLFNQQCSYVHLIIYDDGSMLCVMPDGQWHVFSSVPSSISLNVTNNVYSFTCGYTTLTGNSKYAYCAMIVNAMKKPSDTKATVSLGTNCKSVFYCKKLHTDDFTFNGGSSEAIENIITGSTSLVYVTTVVYDPLKTTVVATSDSYFNIRNW